MNEHQDQPANSGEFVRIPGTGFIRLRAIRPDVKTKAEARLPEEQQPKVSLWSGYVTLETGVDVQIRGQGSDRAKKYEMEIRAFPKKDSQESEQDWVKLGEFSFDHFGDANYADIQGVRIYGRPYKLRVIRSPRGYMLVRLPQVTGAKAGVSAMK